MFKFYNSGICLSEVRVENDQARHKMFDVFSGQWLEEKTTEDAQALYPVEIKRLLEKVYAAEKFDFQSAGDAFELSGERYLLQDEQGDVKTFAHRGIQRPIDLVVSNADLVALIVTDRNGCSVMVKPGYEAQTPVALWKSMNQSRAICSLRKPMIEKIPMRDGTLLHTTTWLPDTDAETFSTVLLRTPYGTMNYFLWLQKFVMRGYALVIQDVRGREESEGEWMPYYYEENDGEDTLEFIASQTWSNGRVGMIGGSYSGGVQWAANVTGSPYLKAMISQVTSGSPFGDIPRRGGAFFSGIMAWAFAMSEQKMNRENMVRDDWDELLNILPIKDIPKAGLGRDVSFINSWMTHENYDEYWKMTDWTRCDTSSDAPALIVSGWYDDNGMGSSEAWRFCKKMNQTETKMILGPWLHQANSTREINGVDFGNKAIRYDLDRIYLDWFDHYLNGVDNGVNSLETVQYYLNGSNTWESASNWPPTDTEEVLLYLGKDGKCSFDNQEETGAVEYDYDPMNPAPFLIDLSSNECNVPANYSQVEAREDVVLFTSAPLEEDLAIAGDVKARLFASTSCVDTDWVVRLTEVLDDETSIRISDGLIRAKFRKGYDQKQLLEPGETYSYDIEMFKAAHRFKKGSRIRISVTSGAKNLIFPNLNTGNDIATDKDFVVAKQTVKFGGEYPSAVILPIIE